MAEYHTPELATRYVAIMSLIIHLVVGAESVSCVSMLASLVLEGFETPLPSVAAISILRFRNGGAWTSYSSDFSSTETDG